VKRRDFIKVTGIGVAGAATMAAPAIAQSMPEIKWRMTTSWPKSLDTLHGAAVEMARVVGEATDNKFQIQTFAAGEIVPGLQVLDAVQNGTVEMGHTASYYYFGKDPTFTFGSCIPFGPNARLSQAWYMLGGGRELLNEFYKGYNVTALLAGNTTCQMGGWFRKEINTVDDLQGLKFRIGGYAGRVMQKLGCVPQQLAGGDIYPALEKGTIDAAEWSALMTTRSSASTKSRRITIIPAGGKAARCCSRWSISRNGMRCRNTTRTFSNRPATTPTTG
jgi:TRAP-type mannitol/chloroaromatic compound transport system substrate-binding protein